MLVLTRLISQKVLIKANDGTIITIMVTGIKPGGRVLLGFDAPSDVIIAREEVAKDMGPRRNFQDLQKDVKP